MRYLAVTCLLMASLSAAVAQMTHEETMVRTAYAKFAYAVQQGAIGELAGEANGWQVPEQYAGLTGDQRLAAAQVSFTLTDFVIGDVRDILNRKAFDLISPPVAETLTTSVETSNFSDNGLATRWGALEARWQPAHVLSQAAMALTVGDMYEVQWHKQRSERIWETYASYSVTVTFQGKSRGPYKGLFIFGHDDKGNEVIEPKDETTSIPGIAFALSEPLFPEPFVLTRMRSLPVVVNWLDANEMSGPGCSVGKGDVCCDLVKMKCGPGRADVSAGLARALPNGSLLKP
jgi:hypothetical protein